MTKNHKNKDDATYRQTIVEEQNQILQQQCITQGTAQRPYITS